MTNSAQGNAAHGDAAGQDGGNDMTIAARQRRPGWLQGGWFRWVAGLPVVAALLFTSRPIAQA